MPRHVLRRLLPLALLVGALVGLLGQGAALALGPAWQSVTATASTAPADCMKMMQGEPDDAPCKGLSLDCIAAMGCTVPVVLAPDAAPVALDDMPKLSVTPLPLPVLTGRSVAPTTHPPTRLI